MEYTQEDNSPYLLSAWKTSKLEKDNACWLVVGEDPQVKGIVVLAVGGNSIVKPTQKGEISEQLKNIDAMCCDTILPILKHGYKVVLVFGKGPLMWLLQELMVKWLIFLARLFIIFL